MAYELIGRVTTEGSSAKATCSSIGPNNATISVTGATASTISWVGDTEYDMNAGDAAHNFSFAGQIPHNQLLSFLNSASSASLDSLLAAHVQSYNSFLGGFSLSIGHTPDLSKSTDELKEAYKTDTGNPYLEWLLFNFGRYLLVGSAPGILPANLQGKWGRDLSNPWGAGVYSMPATYLYYLCRIQIIVSTDVPCRLNLNISHDFIDANINLQMNYWFAEMTNMNLVKPVFDYMEVSLMLCILAMS